MLSAQSGAVQRIPLWGLVFGLHARRTRTGRRRRSAGTNSPVDCWLARGRVPGECGGQQDLEGDAHSVSRCGGLLLVCTLGGLEQLRRRPPPAAETGSRSRGSGRRGGGPLKGRTPMREPQPARRRRSAGTNSPVDCWLARGRVPGGCGGQQGLTWGQPYGKRRAAFLLL